jgi:restriction endonuclease S subunit
MKRLSEVANIISGYPFRGRVPEKKDGNTAVIQMKDVDLKIGVNWSGLVKTHLEGRRKPDWLEPGDILFLSRGNHNYAFCLDEVPIPVVSSPHFFLIRLDKRAKVIPEFLAWQINQVPAQNYFNVSAEGTRQRSIKRSVLENFKVKILEQHIQRKIVYLDRLVKTEISLYSDLIKNRKQMLKAVAFDILNKNGSSKRG